MFRPIKEITGATDFNEVFLDDVFVPDEDVRGNVSEGWAVARAIFDNERVSLGDTPLSIEIEALLAPDSQTTIHMDATNVRAAGTLLAEAHAVRALNVRHAARAVRGRRIGAEGNVAKLVGSEHAQRVAWLGMRIEGLDSVFQDSRVAHDFLFTRCLTIAGGASEVMRTLIGERFLGLPRG
jgi:alkylation response protein AidB-like acyl-CoA dehydrogenase